jgi:hypothetical protein
MKWLEILGMTNLGCLKGLEFVLCMLLRELVRFLRCIIVDVCNRRMSQPMGSLGTGLYNPPMGRVFKSQMGHPTRGWVGFSDGFGAVYVRYSYVQVV